MSLTWEFLGFFWGEAFGYSGVRNQGRSRAWRTVSFGVAVDLVRVEWVFQGGEGVAEGGGACRNSSTVRGTLEEVSSVVIIFILWGLMIIKIHVKLLAELLATILN